MWISLSILLIYFVFTSGIAFKIGGNEMINNLDIPYSFALSSQETGAVGVFTEDDIECAEWLSNNSCKILPIVSDINGHLLLRSLMDDESRIITDRGGIYFSERENFDRCYIFVTTWNTVNQRFLEGARLGAGLRGSYDLPILDYEEVYRRGQSIVYLKETK
jgi:uncharacterized membrane protein